MSGLPRALRWDADGPALAIIDQTKLPGETAFLRLTSADQVFQAIRALQVRGAPAIGLAAAWGMVLGLHGEPGETLRDLEPAFLRWKDRLASSRPTAVNLPWALERQAAVFSALPSGLPRNDVLAALTAGAAALQADDEEMCRRIGENGLALLEPGWGLLTHCNAGAIATARWGTALAPVHLGQERGYDFRVWADETRPLL